MGLILSIYVKNTTFMLNFFCQYNFSKQEIQKDLTQTGVDDVGNCGISRKSRPTETDVIDGSLERISIIIIKE